MSELGPVMLTSRLFDEKCPPSTVIFAQPSNRSPAKLLPPGAMFVPHALSNSTSETLENSHESPALALSTTHPVPIIAATMDRVPALEVNTTPLTSVPAPGL